MTRAVQQIRTEPDGNPAVGIETQVRRLGDSRQVGDTLTSDSNGIVTFTENGSLGPITLGIYGQPGGDRSLASGEAMTSGVFSPAELPAAFSVLGDGVIRGYLGELAVSIAGDTLTVSTGGAVVAGYPVIFYTPTTILLPRPAASTRVDRVVVYIAPLTGIAIVGVLLGEEGGGVAQELTQTAERTEIGLAQVTVGTVQPIEPPTDERVFAGDRLDVVGSERLSSATTTSAPGAAIPDLAVTLTLPRSVTYDVEAEITGQQVGVVPTSAWTVQATYGPSFNSIAMSTPGQVAVDSTGRILIADTGNDRLVILTSAGAYATGITGLTGITGVCVDSSDTIYVAYWGGTGGHVRRYTSALGLTHTSGSMTGNHLRHITTDGTTIYATHDGNRIIRFLAADMSYVGPAWGFGVLTTPWGIVYKASIAQVVVVDAGNAQLLRYSTSGVLQSQVSMSAGMRGIALDAGGDEWVAGYTDERASSTGGDAIPQANPGGMAFATGDVAWITDVDAGTINTWDEATTPGGYGQIALELDGTVSAYTGIGQRVGAVANSATGTKVGPGSVLVRGYAKATANTFSMSGLVLSARATPRG